MDSNQALRPLFTRMTCALVPLVAILIIAGCTGPPYLDHLTGEPMNEYPHFLHKDIFLEGEDVLVTIDAFKYSEFYSWWNPWSDKFDIYVVEHMSDLTWQQEPELHDITPDGPETVMISPGLFLIPAKRWIVWPNATLPQKLGSVYHKHYDVVLDLDQDGRYVEENDIIDRIGVLDRFGAEESGGFTLFRDPVEKGVKHTSTEHYALGSYKVPILPGDPFSECDDPTIVTLRGMLYFPTDFLTTALSGEKLPLVLIAHGVSGEKNSYLGYDYIGHHLASRGFVCASIDLNNDKLDGGWKIHHRGHIIVEHLKRIFHIGPGTSLSSPVRKAIDPTSIGLLGHSRGGEAVVAAQDILEQSGLTELKLRAIAAFAPTDGTWSNMSCGGDDASPSETYDPAVPYMVLYGSRDGDVYGASGRSGIRTHDRASRPRSLVYIHGANHAYFNQKWPDETGPKVGLDPYTGQQKTYYPDAPVLIEDRSKVEDLTLFLVTVFYSNHLLDQQAYADFLVGHTVPKAVPDLGMPVVFSDQPKRIYLFPIDNSEQADGSAINTMENANTFEPVDANPMTKFQETSLEFIGSTPNFYIHDTRGLRFEWHVNSSFTLGTTQIVTWFVEYLSFRVAERYRMGTSNMNIPEFPPQIGVSLTDNSGTQSPIVYANSYGPIPFTDRLKDENDTYLKRHKSVMGTIRIPIRAFTLNGAAIDLMHVNKVTFWLSSPRGQGELIFDDIEFLGMDMSEPETPGGKASKWK